MEPLEQLRSALGLPTLEAFRPEWEDFKKEYALSYSGEKAAEEENDRAWFAWQSFRGEHRPQSCLLDADGRVIGLILVGTGLEELSLPALPALQYLCVCGNTNLRSVQFGGEYPRLVHVDLSGNALTRLKIKVQFQALEYLSICKNRIDSLNLDIVLPELRELDASNNQIKNWDRFIIDKLPSVEYVFLDENPLNESIKGYWDEGAGQNYTNCLKKFLNAFEGKEAILNDEFKVLVIGDGKAGKSCMIHRLVEDSFLEHWNSTHGISVRQFDPNSDDRFGRFPYKLNLWDFGGQDIYHHTHRMFLQSGTVYILLWNEETEFKDFIFQETKRRRYEWRNKKLVYWLDYVRYLGKNSPVVVAQTRSLDRQKGHPSENSIIGRYKPELPFLSNFLQLDAKSDDLEENGYEALVDNIKAAIKSLKRNEYLPERWVEIRKQLDSKKTTETAENERAFLGKGNHTLDYEEYCSIATEAGEENPDLLLNNWLVQTGVVFYKKGLFGDKIILNQSWAIRAVYALYDRSEDGYYSDIEKNKGGFDGALLNNCWSDYSPEEREWFLQFMLKAELCFEIKQDGETPWEKRKFVALEMLPEKQSEGIRILKETWSESKVALCELRYVYPFLHLGVIQSFIARTYRYAEEVNSIYKNGLLIKVGDARVVVEALPKEKLNADEHDAQSGMILVSTPKEHIAVLRRIQKEFEEIHAKEEVEQHVRVSDSPWVDWKILNKNSHAPQISTVDREVWDTAPYLPFLRDDKIPVISLSKDRGILRDDYPKGPQIIEVQMASNAASKVAFEEVKKPVKLLFTAATPRREGQINTGLESRLVDKIKLYDDDGKFKFEQEHGLGKEGFRDKLFIKNPHIIHFAGHGSYEGLALEDSDIDASVLFDLIQRLDNTQLVVLNACYTLPMAKEIAKYVPYVIGTQGPLDDDAAIAFARSFYTGIAGGRDIESSFWFGLDGIKAAKAGSQDILVLVKGLREQAPKSTHP